MWLALLYMHIYQFTIFSDSACATAWLAIISLVTPHCRNA